MASELTRQKLDELEAQIEALRPIVEQEELSAQQIVNIHIHTKAELDYNERHRRIALDKKYRGLFKEKHEKEISDAISAELSVKKVTIDTDTKKEMKSLEEQAKKLLEDDALITPMKTLKKSAK